MEEQSVIGYFGKIPSKGDFITCSLSMDFTEPWDVWLRGVLAHTKSVLSDSWMELYLTSPVYHFSLSSGVCGNSTWLGVFMPSVDSVGRYFPMTICQSFPSHSNPLDLLTKEKKWLQDAENLLLTCLEDDFSLDNFESDLMKTKAVDNSDTTITLKKAKMYRFDDSVWGFPVHENEASSVVYPELLNSMLGTFFSTYSIWRTNGSDNVPSNLVVSEGLPPYKSCPAFIDGKWNEWGWSDEQIIR